MGAGLLIAFCYIIFAAVVTGVGSYFVLTLVDVWFGINIFVWGYMVLFFCADDGVRVVPH